MEKKTLEMQHFLISRILVVDLGGTHPISICWDRVKKPSAFIMFMVPVWPNSPRKRMVGMNIILHSFFNRKNIKSRQI